MALRTGHHKLSKRKVVRIDGGADTRQESGVGIQESEVWSQDDLGLARTAKTPSTDVHSSITSFELAGGRVSFHGRCH